MVIKMICKYFEDRRKQLFSSDQVKNWSKNAWKLTTCKYLHNCLIAKGFVSKVSLISLYSLNNNEKSVMFSGPYEL